MEVKEIFLASMNESMGYLTRALDGLTQEGVTWTPTPHSNNIAFLLWHVTRAQDYWVNEIIRRGSSIYETEGWREKLGTPKDIGTGYTEEQLQAWPMPKLESLRGYARAMYFSTRSLLESITLEELAETRQPGDAPMTIGASLAHLITEIAMHVGQIDYLRGVHRGLKPINW